MRSLLLHPEALKEIDDSAKYYHDQSEGLEIKFLDQIESAYLKIQKNPELFPCVDSDIHKYILSKFPFSIFYKIYPNEIIIFSVSHQKRHPDYWKHRFHSR
jgi:toxin ParE1/3/4